MLDLTLLLAFLPAALALNLTPGADMVVCLTQGARGGAHAAWSASAGVALGVCAHALIAGLGLAAVLAAVPWAFDVLRWIGVAYLLWLALQMLRARPDAGTTHAPQSHAFRRAFMVNLTNPKVALFILAFVPQFVAPQHSVLAQFLLYGGIIALGGFFVNGLAGMYAGRLGARLLSGRGVLDRICAAVFAGLAVRLAMMERA